MILFSSLLKQHKDLKGRRHRVVSELIRHLIIQAIMESYWPSPVDRAASGQAVRDQRPLLGRLLLVPNQTIIQVHNKKMILILRMTP